MLYAVIYGKKIFIPNKSSRSNQKKKKKIEITVFGLDLKKKEKIFDKN